VITACAPHRSSSERFVPSPGGELVERPDQIVVELHEHLASSHDHLVTPMVNERTRLVDGHQHLLGRQDQRLPSRAPAAARRRAPSSW
jgi:hypothetical protein